MKKMAKTWYYTWDMGNYTNGLVLGFETKEDAINHAKKHRTSCDIEIEEITGIAEIYTGE